MTLPALYTLAEEYRDAAERMADLDLPPEVIADTLEGLAGDLTTKATNVAMFVRSMESLADQIKAAEEQMAERRKAIERRADHVRQYLMSNMLRAGIGKIECPYFVIAVRDNPPSVVVDAEPEIPGEYMVQPPAPTAQPDKKAIAAAFKAGGSVPGAHMERTQRIDIK